MPNEYSEEEDEKNAIVDELIEEAIWEICFIVHRSVKLGFYCRDENETEEKTIRDILPVREVDTNKSIINVSCPECQKKFVATKYAQHLGKCLLGEGRSSCKAGRSVDYDETIADSDSEVEQKKRNKRSAGKKRGSRKRVPGSIITETVQNDLGMSFEQRKIFFAQKCGVISKHTRKMCTNSTKCSAHTNEDRDEVRQLFLKDFGDQLAMDVQIDVDTVDDKIDGLAYFMQNNSIFSSENAMSPGSDFNESKPSTSSKSGSSTSSKKKKSLSPSSSISVPSPLAVSGSSFESV